MGLLTPGVATAAEPLAMTVAPEKVGWCACGHCGCCCCRCCAPVAAAQPQKLSTRQLKSSPAVSRVHQKAANAPHRYSKVMHKPQDVQTPQSCSGRNSSQTSVHMLPPTLSSVRPRASGFVVQGLLLSVKSCSCFVKGLVCGSCNATQGCTSGSALQCSSHCFF